MAGASGAMTHFSTPGEALASIPGWADHNAAIQPLTGGYNNRSYKVTVAERHYVLRLASNTSQYDARNFTMEQQIHTAAAAAGIAPAIVYANPEHGLLLSEFLPGRTWQPGDLLDDRNLHAIAALLRQVHALPPCGQIFPAAEAAEAYGETLAEQDADHETAALCIDIVTTSPKVTEPVCCHNDVVTGNIVGDNPPRLIDWEYARDNDPLFDLASLIGWHDIDGRRIDVLLEAYSNGATASLRRRLLQRVRQFDALQWLWLAVRGGDVSRMERVRDRLVE
ncbi:MAG: choline/ethanolamine kinase family protein [Woeseia sp.]